MSSSYSVIIDQPSSPYHFCYCLATLPCSNNFTDIPKLFKYMSLRCSESWTNVPSYNKSEKSLGLIRLEFVLNLDL